MELLSLPREIVGEILSYSSVSDLPSLHLVSKFISALTYEYFEGKVLDPDMGETEKAKYKRMRETYTLTTCFILGCKNETRRQIYCKEHDGFKHPAYSTILRDGSKIEACIHNNFPNNDLVFRIVKGGYIEFIGCVEEHMIGSHEELRITDGVDKDELNGNRYNPSIGFCGTILYNQ